MAGSTAELLRGVWTIGAGKQVQPRVHAVFVNLWVGKLDSDDLIRQVLGPEAKILAGLSPSPVKLARPVQFLLQSLRGMLRGQLAECGFGEGRPINAEVAGRAT